MAGNERSWSRGAWLGLSVGVCLAIWGVSMGFSRRSVSGSYTQVNWEAVIRAGSGVLSILVALIVASVIAPQLSQAERRGWAAVIWIATATTAVVSLVGLIVALWENDSICGSRGFAEEVNCVLGASVAALAVSAVIASLVTILWVADEKVRVREEPQSEETATPSNEHRFESPR